MPFYLRGLWGSFFSRAGAQLKANRRGGRVRDVVVAFGEPLDASFATPELVAAELDWQIIRTYRLQEDRILVRDVMNDSTGIYPKNDLMVGALEPLVGDSIFVSSGAKWRRQRDMIDPEELSDELRDQLRALGYLQ